MVMHRLTLTSYDNEYRPQGEPGRIYILSHDELAVLVRDEVVSTTDSEAPIVIMVGGNDLVEATISLIRQSSEEAGVPHQLFDLTKEHRDG